MFDQLTKLWSRWSSWSLREMVRLTNPKPNPTSSKGACFATDSGSDWNCKCQHYGKDPVREIKHLSLPFAWSGLSNKVSPSGVQSETWRDLIHRNIYLWVCCHFLWNLTWVIPYSSRWWVICISCSSAYVETRLRSCKRGSLCGCAS